MSIITAMRVPLGTDLAGFVALLRRLNLPHRVTESGGEQVLWVPDERFAEQVRSLYDQYPQGDPDGRLELPPAARSRGANLTASLRQAPVTSLVLVACLIVAGLTLLGDNLDTVRWLTFLDFKVSGDYLYFMPWTENLAQPWRLLTPILLHFGILHLAMNSLWYWELGRRIEWRQGPWLLLALTLGSGAVSNVAQYVWSGPTLFGGLSGVLYALLGHLWLYNWLAPHPLYQMPRGVLVMMLVWLVVCMTGVIGTLGLGEIANAAHVGGLLVGCLTGLLGGLLARRKLPS